MQLRNLSCQNCGANLIKEGDHLVCQSCGSVFAIDYDDSDVEFEKVTTEAERKQAEYEHQKEMLETEYKLKEEAEIRKTKRQKADARKSVISNAVVRLIRILISLAIFGAMFYGLIYLVRNSRNIARNIENNIETTTTQNKYIIDKKVLEADKDFMDNALAAVRSVVHEERDDSDVRFWNGEKTQWDIWKVCKEPKIYESYLLTNEKENRVYFLVELTYNNVEDKKDKEQKLYDAFYFKKVTIGEDGKVKCDYDVHSDRPGSTDFHWNGSHDKDQLKRTAIIGNTKFSYEEITLPEDANPEETEETTKETTKETSESTKETTKKSKKKKSK